MLEKSVLSSVKKYIGEVKASGIDVERVVVFGSQVQGNTHQWSDIDVVVISSSFDGMTDRSAINTLWRIAARVDSRIEPVLCGSRQWEEDDSSALIEIARRSGEVLDAA